MRPLMEADRRVFSAIRFVLTDVDDTLTFRGGYRIRKVSAQMPIRRRELVNSSSLTGRATAYVVDITTNRRPKQPKYTQFPRFVWALQTLRTRGLPNSDFPGGSKA